MTDLQEATYVEQAAAAAIPPQTVRRVPFVFTGQGGEYFKIWIVNILLSVVTLGIYSAWAKVRNKQYFYGNTSLDGSSFSYTANPRKILVGRIIAFVFLVLYVSAEHISLWMAIVMPLIFFFAFPWVMCKSLRFNAHYSRYRNVPFVFHGTMWEAIGAFFFLPIVGILSLGVLMPYAYYKQKSFIYGEHAYGDTGLSYTARPSSYYKIFLGIVVILVLMGTAAFLLGKHIGPTAPLPVVAAGYLLVFAFFTVASTNVNYNNLGLERHRFGANWKLGSYVWLMLSNTVGIVLTLGLFIPWAKVRTARYKAEHTWCMIDGDLEAIVAEEQEKVAALGEGVGDLFDIEIGL